MHPTIPEFLRSMPTGWRVVSANIAHLGDDEPPFGASYDDLIEDFIVVHSDSLAIGIELDWFPERSPLGEFRLSAIDFSDPRRLVENYVTPIRTFTTRSLRGGLDELFRWMIQLNENSKNT